METEIVPMGSEARFAFGCNPSRPCFNACCGDLHQALTPYDVLRLRRRLGLGMEEFLSRHGSRHTGPASGMPVVTLRPLPGPERRCPFVTAAGCSVYPDRPSSCRVYPLARALVRDPAGGACREVFCLLREPHCRGFEYPGEQSVAEYLAAQALAPYNRINDRMLALIGMRRRERASAAPTALSEEALFVALYDPERLRAGILAGRMPDGGAPGEEMAAAAGLAEEETLLLAAMDWVAARLSAAPPPPAPAEG
jgi:hypothetical protein